MHHVAMCSAIGPRDQLEDAVFGVTAQGGLPHGSACSLLGVFDGVGGEFGGDVASNLASHVLRRSLSPALTALATQTSDEDLAPDVVMASIWDAIICANDQILVRRSAESSLARMATTAVAGIVCSRLLHLAWAGDSRCYRWRDGVLECLTSDHTELEPYIQEGALTREEAKLHPSAHVITNYLGKPDFMPETRIVQLAPGDVLILCTDGVTDVLDFEDLADEVTLARQGRESLRDLPKHVVGRALRAGTQDNATCLCCAIAELVALPGHINRTITHGYHLTSLVRSQALTRKGALL